MSHPTGPDLFRVYELAVQTCQLEVRLGAQRQAFYLGVSTGLLGVLTAFGKPGWPTALAYLAGTIVAALGNRVVAQSHAYYRSARDHFQTIERQLGLDAAGLAISTTPGMRKETGRRFRISTGVQLVLWILAGLDVLSAVLALASA